jgi:CheY-like chemotaxis protein
VTFLPLVLVVDDETFIADTIALILKQSGFTVIVARSGEEAVQIASALRPDWMVSDVVMGRMSGIDAAIEMQRLCPACHIILISGNAITSDLLDEARSRGHQFEILAKPFHPTELLARLAP